MIDKAYRGLMRRLLGLPPIAAAQVHQQIAVSTRKGRLRNSDHGFASGGVFPRPRTLSHALDMTGREDEAHLLMDVWEQFSTNAIVANDVLLGLNARALNDHRERERIVVGERSVVRGILRQEGDGRIRIGSFVYVGDQSIVNSMSEIVIGDRTLIAHNVNILDNDTHPIDADERAAHFERLLGLKPERSFKIASAPVTIGAHCWLGLNSVVCKGVDIGDRSIVAAGSVVTKSLPADVLAAGVPAVAGKTICKPQAP